MRRLRLLLVIVVVLAAAASPAAAQRAPFDVHGAQRILVIPVTWGPEPFTQDRIQSVVFGETDTWLRTVSYGRAWLAGSVTPWLHVFAAKPSCTLDPISRAARAGAFAAGYNVAQYDKVMYVHPDLGCLYFGITAGDEIWLNGALFRKLVAHELGHTFGLGHANATTMSCPDQECASEYGDPYDTMGSGYGDFNAYDKWELGWLPDQPVARANGEYLIDQLETQSKGPHALRIRTARDELWLEFRRDAAVDAEGNVLDPPGILVRLGPPRTAHGVTNFTVSNLLLADPGGYGRPVLLPGNRFEQPGIFAVTVVSARGSVAHVRFEWVDRTRPTTPHRLAASRDIYGGLNVSWDDAVDTGSGIAWYVVSVDGKRPVRAADTAAVVAAPKPGHHVVTVVAVDRAGNRSTPVRRGFTWRSPN